MCQHASWPHCAHDPAGYACCHPSTLPSSLPLPRPNARRYVKQHIVAAKRTLLGNPYMRHVSVRFALAAGRPAGQGVGMGSAVCFFAVAVHQASACLVDYFGCLAVNPARPLLLTSLAHPRSRMPIVLRSWQTPSTSRRDRPASATTRSASAACRSSRPPSATTRRAGHAGGRGWAGASREGK